LHRTIPTTVSVSMNPYILNIYVVGIDVSAQAILREIVDGIVLAAYRRVSRNSVHNAFINQRREKKRKEKKKKERKKKKKRKKKK
jgi:hypothetical protein